MSSNPTKQDVIALENKYWDAMRSQDIDAAIALTRFPCIVAGPQGARRINEEQYRNVMKKADGSRYDGVQLENPEVDVINADTALISYSTRVNGKAMQDVSTWVRDGKRWVCAFHSETPLSAGE